MLHKLVLNLAIWPFLLLFLCASPLRAVEVPLLNVAEGQLPNDTGQEDKTKFGIEANETLGAKALKVVFASGDSFGMNRAGVVENWKKYIALEFEVLNPSSKTVRLELGVKHSRSTSYQTQVRYPIALKPGKNAVKIGIDELTNVNGSAPNLSSVRQWFLADVARTAPTLHFGNIRLVGDEAVGSSTGPTGTISSLLPAGRGYRVQGTIGDQKVDLTVTPLESSSNSSDGKTIKRAAEFDPARVERIRRAKMPTIVAPVRFDTPEADKILSALEVFPPDHPINQVITNWPVHPNSRAIINSVGADKKLRYNPDMAFVIVPPNQKKVAVEITHYPGESDKGPFPVPDAMPIEGWPVNYQRSAKYRDMTLLELQQDARKLGGDRHALVVDPTNRMLYEFYIARRGKAGWQAAQSSIFDLKSNKMRPEGWTSTDAAGLPVFPTVVRYDELKRGIVEHAMRVTIRNSRRAYVYPARHYASRHENETYPRMGERFRLRQSFDISEFSPAVQAILKGLKKYGMLVADNGIEWAISVTPDPRIPSLHEELGKIRGSDFEVVVAP